MVATYRLRADEINDTFLKNIQSNYMNKEIEITIKEIEDETEYLLKSEPNRRHLLRGIEEMRSGAPLQTMTVEHLENDIEFLFKVIGDIARSKGMAQIAKELNLNRESLYRSLSQDGNPSFSTIVKVLDNLGFQLSVRQKVSA